MTRKIILTGICLLTLICNAVVAQTHSSVRLDSQVYYILEQAELRGLCSPLPGIRPYTESIVVGKINEILGSEGKRGLTASERDILMQYADNFSKQKPGIDWKRGGYYNETAIGKNNFPLSLNAGVTADITGSAGIYNSGDKYYGMESWVTLYMNGDLGRNVSYNFDFSGGLVRAPRRNLGPYNTYYETFPVHEETAAPEDEYVNRKINAYSEPMTYFPYTYQKRWDGSVFFFDDLKGFDEWPNDFAGGYSLPAELTGSFLENKFIIRLGRIAHEWGSTPLGSSLAFNQMARPFVALETEFSPVSWFSMACLTGALEYYNLDGIKDSSLTFQNLFSVTMYQLRYKNFISFELIDAVVYPKRFELGYISPVTNNFFYQNNVGDFDNMALTFNLKAQYPGLGNLWLSLFVDEMDLTSNLFTLDRQMIALQGGINILLPFLSFSSLQLSYTRVNPYCYTHNRNFNPWYGDLRMETGYTNNGVSLGYYLPPNSDELLLRFKTMPAKNVSAHLQYQLIRHGADFGDSAVDGSNLSSELDPDDRNTNLVLKRFFLQDGAYQWLNIIKIGAEWNLPKLPVTLFGEAGVVISFFTDINEDANVTGEAHPFSVINTSEYPKSTGFIINLGFRVFSR